MPDLPRAISERVVGRARVPALQGNLDVAQHRHGMSRAGARHDWQNFRGGFGRPFLARRASEVGSYCAGAAGGGSAGAVVADGVFPSGTPMGLPGNP